MVKSPSLTRTRSQARCSPAIAFGLYPPICPGAALPVLRTRSTHRIAELIPMPNRSAASRRDRPSSTLSEQNVANDCNWACGRGTSSILILQNDAECGTALQIQTLISTWVCNNADDRSTDFQQGEKCEAAPRRQSRFAVRRRRSLAAGEQRQGWPNQQVLVLPLRRRRDQDQPDGTQIPPRTSDGTRPAAHCGACRCARDGP